MKPASPPDNPLVQNSKAPRKYLLVSKGAFPDAIDAGATRST